MLGSVLGTVVAQHIKDGIPALSPGQPGRRRARRSAPASSPTSASLPGAIRVVVESAYGSGVGTVFLLGVPLAVITLVMVALMPNASLGTQTADRPGQGQEAKTRRRRRPSRLTSQRELEDAEDILIEVGAASAGLAPVGMATPTGSIRVQPDADGASGTPGTGR